MRTEYRLRRGSVEVAHFTSHEFQAFKLEPLSRGYGRVESRALRFNPATMKLYDESRQFYLDAEISIFDIIIISSNDMSHQASLLRI